MRRVLVIGSGGAGKSTFATRLAARTGLPLVHLDAVFWKPGWTETPSDEWAKTVERLVGAEYWIMDGNYGGSLDRRIEACDTVVFLDVSRWVCLWRILGRRIRFHRRSRPDMTAGCPERLSWDFLYWILSYPEQRRPKILQRLARLRPEQRAVRLRSASDVERFLVSASFIQDDAG